MNAAAPVLTARETGFRWPLLWTIVVAALLYWGWHAHLELYITPKRGLGYALGITGGSMMLLLLVYSLRKRVPWLSWMGSTTGWFQLHMALGVVGPILILFHADFQLGASNSNVALVCMLLVASSGVVGRYIYTRLHSRMDGHQDTFEQLKAVGDRMRSQTDSVAFVPGVVEAIEQVEKRFIEPPHGAVKPLVHALTGGVRAFLARWLVRREIDRAVARAIQNQSSAGGAAKLTRHAAQITAAASSYAERRLAAGRRAAEFQTYARLFSFWHVLHIPLFFMMLIAAIVHIIAVNLY